MAILKWPPLQVASLSFVLGLFINFCMTILDLENTNFMLVNIISTVISGCLLRTIFKLEPANQWQSYRDLRVLGAVGFFYHLFPGMLLGQETRTCANLSSADLAQAQTCYQIAQDVATGNNNAKAFSDVYNDAILCMGNSNIKSPLNGICILVKYSGDSGYAVMFFQWLAWALLLLAFLCTVYGAWSQIGQVMKIKQMQDRLSELWTLGTEAAFGIARDQNSAYLDRLQELKVLMTDMKAVRHRLLAGDEEQGWSMDYGR